MSYPPDEHVLRDLAIASWLEADDRATAELEVTPAVLDASGRVGAGALFTLVDLACARVALHAGAPQWMATLDLSLVTGPRPAAGTVEAIATIVRVGSKTIAVDIDLGAVGTASGIFARIPREASAAPLDGMAGIGERTQLLPVAPAVDPGARLVERMGLRVGEGVAELDRSPYVANSFGTVNGGIMGFLVAAAAESATGWTACDLTLRYISQTKVGPARATAGVVRHGVDHAVVDVRVVDAGGSDAVLARALVTTAP